LVVADDAFVLVDIFIVDVADVLVFDAVLCLLLRLML